MDGGATRTLDRYAVKPLRECVSAGRAVAQNRGRGSVAAFTRRVFRTAAAAAAAALAAAATDFGSQPAVLHDPVKIGV